jgi:hypothetical protein
MDPDKPIPAHILEAVAAARQALVDLTLAERIQAIELLNWWLEVEIAGWEFAQNPQTH